MTNDVTVPEIVVSEQQRVENDPDFILLRRFEYSLEKALKKYPEGLPDNLVAQALGKSVPWVTRRYHIIVGKLRTFIGQ